MKRLSTVLLAIALVLGMTQCKKKVETITSSGQGVVHITLRVDNDSKHSIILDDPNLSNIGKVNFEPGDFVWVVNGNQVVGALGYNGSVFEGNIGVDIIGLWGNITLDEDDYLYFCYSTNMSPDTYLDDDDKEAIQGVPYFLLNIGDQTEKLPVVSFGQTDEKYGYYVENGGLDNLSCMLKNKCSLVKFTLPEATNEVVRLTNVYTITRFDIDKDYLVDATPYTDVKGFISLYNPAGNSPSAERWGVLLSQDEAVNADVVVGNTLYKSAVTIPALENNTLIYDNPLNINMMGIPVELSPSSFYNPITNGWIEMAKGNLQYDKSNNTYSFMDNQWSKAEADGDVGVNYANQNIVSLFGWGAWGKSCTLPYNTDDNYTSFTWTDDFDETLEIDGKTGWRTITAEEALNIFEMRENPDMEKYYSATVNGVHGVIILSDLFIGTINAECDMHGWDNFVISGADWTALENAGAVFFPAAGRRRDSYVNDSDNMNAGGYWTSGKVDIPDPDQQFRPFITYFSANYFSCYPSWASFYGFSVRLVRDIE